MFNSLGVFACDFALELLPRIVKMDVSIQTDPVDPQEIWNILIQHHKEQENLKKVRHSGGVLKHYQQNQDAIQLAEGDSRFEVEMLQRNFNNNPPKVKPQTPTVSPARSYTPHYDIKSKESRSEQSLSDRICHVVWRRKVSSPSVTPLGSKRVPNSVRRGTIPNVPPFSLQKPDVFGRSQSFKGSSWSGSFKNRAASHRDPLSRRASGSALATAASVALSQLKAKNNKLNPGCTAVVGGLDYGHNNLGQNEHSSLNSSIGSGQNLSSNLAAAVIPLERKLGGGLAAKSRDGDVDMRRQISMTLSIPSREDSVRSYASSKSYVSFSAVPTSEIAGGQMKPSMKKLVRYGSNPDVFSSHRTRQRDEERESFYLPSRAKIASSKSLASCDQERSRSRSNSNIGSTFSGGIAHSTCLSDKKKQILSQKQKRNEKVAWAVHLGFSSLLILAIACIVVFLRLSSTVPPPDFETTTTTTSEPVRKENENLLQSIQPQLNLQNLTTPQPTTTHSVQDNSIANQDTGMDKSIASLQSGQSLTRSKVTSSINDNQGETGDETKSNKTTNANLDVSDGGGGENSSSFNRSNNDVINSDNDNPSLKSNSDRPKRSRPRSKLEDGGEPSSSSRSSSIIISVLNEKVSAIDHLNDTPGLAKTRHLESSIIRFLKNTNGQERRERRNLESGSRNL